jgi:hypothetical protein
VRAREHPLSGPVIQQKALEFARGLDTQILASVGWLCAFRGLHQIKARVVCGEAGSVSEDTLSKLRNGQEIRMITEYTPDEIFNSDETVLLFQLLPTGLSQIQAIHASDAKCLKLG